MRKSVAGQVICAQLNSRTDGSAVTSGTTTVYVLGDGGTQGAGAGTVTHEGNGCWSYAPTQAETNYNHVAFTFVNTSAVAATVNAYPVSFDPYDATRLGLAALPNAAAEAAGGLVTSGTGAGQLSVSAGRVTLADGVTHGGSTAALSLQSVVVSRNSVSPAVLFANTGSGAGLSVTGAGALPALQVVNSGSGIGFSVTASAGAAVSWSGATYGLSVAGTTDDVFLTNSDAPTLAAAVWAGATRTLTAATNITSTGGAITLTGGAVDLNPAQAVSAFATDGTVGEALAALTEGLVVVGTVGVGAITAASIATGAIDADALAADAGTEIGTAVWASATRTLTGGVPTAAENADALLGRNVAGGSSTGRTVGQAFASLRNKVAFDVPGAGQFTVYDTDDVTPLYTGTYTASAGANPVTALDPA